jgi:hypothetical protein
MMAWWCAATRGRVVLTQFLPVHWTFSKHSIITKPGGGQDGCVCMTSTSQYFTATLGVVTQVSMHLQPAHPKYHSLCTNPMG